MRASVRSIRIFAAAAAVATLAWAAPVTRAQTKGAPVRFTAMAVNMSNVGRDGTGTVQIEVDRWSSQADREKLVSTLLDKGPEKLLDVLRDMPRVGYIRSTTSIGWDLHYAHETPLPEGGRRIILATDRPIGFREAYSSARTLDYPFTVIEIHMNRDGEGEGKMSIATRITADKEDKVVQLEDFANQPVMLKSVKEERTSR
jgi:hypothetical protein